MFSMLINSVWAEHVLQEEEWVVVLVLDSLGILEDSNTDVRADTVSDEDIAAHEVSKAMWAQCKYFITI